MKYILNIAIFTVFIISQQVTAVDDEVKLIDVKCIWSQGMHNAFTDLLRYNDSFYCTFRQSDKHVYGQDGQIRIITSKDGNSWESSALISKQGTDLRDPKLSITPEGKMMLLMGGSVYEGRKLVSRQPHVSFSTNGTDWTRPKPILTEGQWLWRITWYDNKGYGVSYGKNSINDHPLALYKTSDGIDYEVITTFDIPGRPNETTIRFKKDGTAVALVRREEQDKNAWIGTSKPPYNKWQWNNCGRRVGGPDFIIIPDDRMFAGGRLYPNGPKTALAKMTETQYLPEVILPSGGDTSYPAFCLYENILWMTYYSSHEGKGNIYLARFKVKN